jgi:N-acetylmuramoyl-L-alanine amidase
MRVILDRQHAGQVRRPDDRGAAADLDGDHVIGQHEREAMITPLYILAAEARLIMLGHEVIVISDGTYPERAARAIGYAADVYVACHANAGAGDYGLAIANAGSTSGAALATAITAKLRTLCPELRRVVVGDTSAASYPRAAACIGGVAKARAVGICYEPGFLDQPSHAPMWSGSGPTRVGQALAEGIDAWGSSR